MTQSVVARTTSAMIGMLAVVIVASVVYFDLQDTSPGDLTTVHAQHAGLTGKDKCNACHGADGQTMSEACLQCHAEIDRQQKTLKGFHGSIMASAGKECAECHSEHHGNEFPITSDKSFALAGVADLQQFDHAGLEFRLTGWHNSKSCGACHRNANLEVLPTGKRRFMGLSQECSECHNDVHKGTFGNDCESCHGQEHPFRHVAEFDHTAAFALVGGHEKVACTKCHSPDSPNAIETLIDLAATPSRKPLQARNCGDCHASPHRPDFLSQVASELELTVEDSCKHCHNASHQSFAGIKNLDTTLHHCTGFRLTPPHGNLTCKACHSGFGESKPDLTSFHQSYPGRHPDDCRVCHGDPHLGQFASNALGELNCIDCHHRDSFVPSAFTLSDHQQTKFPLVGAHAQTDCHRCHQVQELTPQPEDSKRNFVAVDTALKGQPKITHVRVFRGISTSCQSCHQDPHRGQFDTGVFAGSDCNLCHDEHSFQQSTFSIRHHARTRFPLSGAHTAVACISCHPNPDDAAAETRVFRSSSTKCSHCHEDVHRGRFDLPKLPKVVDGETDCARCHTTESFRVLKGGGFDHGRWTGYELQGPHARAKCVDCHGNHVVAGSQSSGNHLLDGNRCQTCHQDPHVGQFGATANIDCAECHTVGDSFRELVFDHQLHSRFKLDREHARLPCGACHKPQRLVDGRSATRYKPLGTRCGDCHLPFGSRSRGAQ